MESDSGVLFVKEGGVLSHEVVSQDHVVERRREHGSHNAHNTLSYAVLSHSNNVVLLGQNVVNFVNSEGNVWQVFSSPASLMDYNSINELIHKFLRSHDN